MDGWMDHANLKGNTCDFNPESKTLDWDKVREDEGGGDDECNSIPSLQGSDSGSDDDFDYCDDDDDDDDDTKSVSSIQSASTDRSSLSKTSNLSVSGRRVTDEELKQCAFSISLEETTRPCKCSISCSHKLKISQVLMIHKSNKIFV